MVRGLGDERLGSGQGATQAGDEPVQRRNERAQLGGRGMIDRTQVVRAAPPDGIGEPVDRTQNTARGEKRQHRGKRKGTKAKRGGALGDALRDGLLALPRLGHEDQDRDRFSRDKDHPRHRRDPDLGVAKGAGIENRRHPRTGGVRQRQVGIPRQRLVAGVDPVEYAVGRDRAENRKGFVGKIYTDAFVPALKALGDGEGGGAEDPVLRGFGGLVRNRSHGEIKHDGQERGDAEKLENQSLAQR